VSELERKIQSLVSELAASQKKVADLQSTDKQTSKDAGKVVTLEKELKKAKADLGIERQKMNDERRVYDEQLKIHEKERDDLRKQLATLIDRYRATALTSEEQKFVKVIQEDMQKAFVIDQTSAKNDVKRLTSDNKKLRDQIQDMKAQMMVQLQLAKTVSISQSSSTEATPNSFAVPRDSMQGDPHQTFSAAGRPVRNAARRSQSVAPAVGSPSRMDDENSHRPPNSTVNPLDTIAKPPISNKRPRGDDIDEFPSPSSQRAKRVSMSHRAPALDKQSKAASRRRR